MDDHLTPQEIQAFIEGRLDRRERVRMLEHLDHCRMCVSWLADGVREFARWRATVDPPPRLQSG